VTQSESDLESIPQIKAESVREITPKIIPVCEVTQSESDGESIPQIKAESVREITPKIIPVCEVTQSESDGESIPQVKAESVQEMTPKIEQACEVVLQAEKIKQTEPVGELVIQDDSVSSCVMTEIMLSPTITDDSVEELHEEIDKPKQRKTTSKRIRKFFGRITKGCRRVFGQCRHPNQA